MRLTNEFLHCRKLLLLFAILVTSSSSLEITCEYSFVQSSEQMYYACGSSHFSYADASEPFTILGDHIDVNDDNDVESVRFLTEVQLKVIPTQIFQKFLNLKELLVIGSGSRQNNLEVIQQNSFVGASNLKVIFFLTMIISRLEDNTFLECRNLEHLKIILSEISFISANAFNGLDNLISIDFSSNRIAELNPEIFNHMPKLESLKLSSNDLATISANIFSTAINLVILQLDFNGIRAIQIHSFEDLPMLELVDLSLNICTESVFRKNVTSGLFVPGFDTLENCHYNYENPNPSTIIPETTTDTGFAVKGGVLSFAASFILVIWNK